MTTVETEKTATTFGELSKSRFNNFDFLRFFFATLVILSHAKIDTHAVVGGASDGSGPVSFTGPGRFAVNCFFVISGFLITMSWERSKTPADYFKRRFLRIYPAFALTLCLCAFVVGPLGGAVLPAYFQDPSTYQFVLQGLLFGPIGTLHGVFTHLPYANLVDVPLWSIRYELLCYLMVAALGAMGILRYRGAILGLFIVMFSLFAMQENSWPIVWLIKAPYFGTLEQLFRTMTFFLAGATFYLFRDKIRYSNAAAVACAIVLMLPMIHKLHFLKGSYVFTLPLLFTYLIFWTAFNANIKLQNWAKNGDFSYGMYLYAFPILQLTIMYLQPHMHLESTLGRAVLIASNVSLTFVAAFLSWKLLEKPALTLAHRGSARPAAVATQPPAAIPPAAVSLPDAEPVKA